MIFAPKLDNNLKNEFTPILQFETAHRLKCSILPAKKQHKTTIFIQLQSVTGVRFSESKIVRIHAKSMKNRKDT